MRKFYIKRIFVIIFLWLSVSMGHAAVLPLAPNTYETPDNWQTLFSTSDVTLTHGYYYLIGLDDVSNYEATGLNVVFHNISNWRVEDNWLNVYLYDDASFHGLRTYVDASGVTVPDWSFATLLGTWSYENESKDVVFYTEDPSLLAMLNNGHTFGIGIDPDCYYNFDEITIETNAPVPEPISILLLGTGLLGIAGFRRMKF